MPTRLQPLSPRCPARPYLALSRTGRDHPNAAFRVRGPWSGAGALGQTRTRRFGEHGSPKTELLAKAEEAARCPTAGHVPPVASVSSPAALRPHLQNCDLLSPIFITTDETSETLRLALRQSQVRQPGMAAERDGGALGSIGCPACPPCRPLLGEAWDAPASAWHFLQCRGTNPIVLTEALWTEGTCRLICTVKACDSVAFPASSGVTSTLAHFSHLSKTPYG